MKLRIILQLEPDTTNIGILKIRYGGRKKNKQIKLLTVIVIINQKLVENHDLKNS